MFLTHASVQQPLQPCDDDDDRRLMENCCIKEAKQQWDLKHPPQKTARAVRVPVTFTLLMCALATAYRLQRERAALGAEPVGWQRWRRQLQEQNRDKLIVCARGYDGIVHVAEYSLLLGVKRKDVPPGSAPCQKSWRGIGSPLMGEPYVGISVLLFPHPLTPLLFCATNGTGT